jgi:hypothetical protein
MRVTNLSHSRLQVERIFPDLYEEMCKEFFETDDILLPTYKTIELNYQNPDDLRMLLKDLTILIETDEENITVNLKRGWFTDFGSVPKQLRSVIPYDDINYIIGYLVHDGWFGSKKGFTFGNELLREILRFKGVAWRKIHYVYYAVQLLGKSAYTGNELQKARESKFIEIIRTKK